MNGQSFEEFAEKQRQQNTFEEFADKQLVSERKPARPPWGEQAVQSRMAGLSGAGKLLTGPEAKSIVKDIPSGMLGTLEGIASTVTGLPAFFAGAGTTLATQPFTGWQKAGEVGQKVSGALTHQPVTEKGKWYAETMGLPFAAFGAVEDAIAETLAPDEPETQAMLRGGFRTALIASPVLKGYVKEALSSGKVLATKVIKSIIGESKEIPGEIKNVVKNIPDVEIPLTKPPAPVKPVGKQAEVIKPTQSDIAWVNEKRAFIREQRAEIARLKKSDKSAVRRGAEEIEHNINEMEKMLNASRVAQSVEQAGVVKEAPIEPTPTKTPKAEPDYAWTPPKEITPEMMAEQQALRRQAAEAVINERARQPLTQKPKGVPGIVAPGFEMGTRFTAAEQAIRNQVAKKPPLPGRIKEAAGGIIKETPYEAWDRFDPILQFVKKGEKAEGMKVDPWQHPYTQVSELGGREGIVWGAQERLRDIVLPVGKYAHELEVYLQARHNIDRFNRGIKNPGGITAKQAGEAIGQMKRRIGPDAYAVIKRAAQKYYEWDRKEIMQGAIDGQLLTKQEAQAMMDKNPHYVPFEWSRKAEEIAREFDVVNKESGSSLFGPVQEAFFRATGAKGKIEPIFETILKRLHLITNLAEKNKAVLSLIDLRDRPPAGEWYDYRTSWWREHIKPTTSKATIPPGYGRLGVVKEGKVRHYDVPEDLVQSYQTLNARELYIIDKVLQKSRGAFTAGTTGYYLPFSIFNVPRDIQMALLTSKYKFNARVWGEGFANALASSFGWPTKLYKTFMEQKGGFGGLIQRGGEMIGGGSFKPSAQKLFEPKWQERVKAVVYPWQLVKNVAQSFELAPRLGIMKEALKHETLTASAMMARSSTIDFYRAGHAMRIVNQWVPFLNARVQAKVATVEAMLSKGRMGELYGKGKGVGPLGIKMKAPAMALAKATTWIAAPALLTWLYNRVYHNDLYQQIPDDYKDRYFVFILGTKINEHTKQKEPNFALIPKGDIGSLIWNPIQHGLDYMWDKAPVEWGKEAIKMLNEISPLEFEREGKVSMERLIGGALPPILRAPVESIANKNLYWGRPIVSERLQKVAPEEQWTPWTPEAYKWIGEQLNVSPLHAQNFARSMFGSIVASPSASSMMEALRGRFTRTAAGGIIEDVYSYNDKISEGYFTARLKAQRALEAGNRGEAIEYLLRWNKDIDPMLTSLAAILKQSPGRIKATPFYKQYTFQAQDIKNLLVQSQRERQSELEKRLKTKIRGVQK